MAAYSMYLPDMASAVDNAPIELKTPIV